MKKGTRCAALFLSLAMIAGVMAGCTNGSSSSAPAQTTEAMESMMETSADAMADTTADAMADTTAADMGTEEMSGPVSFEDMMGREITLEKPADRIVALTASDCEILFALGAGDKLVGRGEYCDYPAEVFDIPSVQSEYETNIEQIIALDPQIVVMATMAQAEEQVAQLEEAGIQVVVSDAQNIEGVYTCIEMLGTMTGKTAEAATIIDDMKATFEEVSAKAGDEPAGSVYFEVSPLEYGLWTAGSGTFMDEIATMLGLENCFADVEGWAEISEEQVIERAPDYIVTITMYFGEGPTPEEEILSRKGWEEIPAVANRCILNLPNNELSRPIPRLADGAKILYDFIHEKMEEGETDKAA